MKRVFIVIFSAVIFMALVGISFAQELRATSSAAKTVHNPEGFVIKPHHVSVYVKSLDESAKWYNDVFGFEEAMRMSGGKMKISFLTTGNWFLELFEQEDPKGWQGHFCFQVNDLAKFHQYCVNKGVEVVRYNPNPPYTTLFIKDNSGNNIEIIETNVSQPHHVK